MNRKVMAKELVRMAKELSGERVRTGTVKARFFWTPGFRNAGGVLSAMIKVTGEDPFYFAEEIDGAIREMKIRIDKAEMEPTSPLAMKVKGDYLIIFQDEVFTTEFVSGIADSSRPSEEQIGILIGVDGRILRMRG